MLISETVMVRWNGFTRKWYEEKGYIWTKANELFECKIEDVQENSTVKVEVKCDYCGETYYPAYRELLNSRKTINKDCCSNQQCKNEKVKDIYQKKYGVDNHMQLESSQEKLRKIRQTPFIEVDKYLKEKGLQIISTEQDYQNNRSEISFICNNHKEFGVQRNNFMIIKRNECCCEHAKDELLASQFRMDGIIVYQDFVNKGLIPKFKPEDYIKNNQHLPYICPNHIEQGVQYKSYGELKDSEHKCKYCFYEYNAGRSRLDEAIVFNYFKERGLLILEGQVYKSLNDYINYRCQKHPHIVQKTTYHNLQLVKEPCELCRLESNITKLSKRLRGVLYKWRKRSEKQCNYQCVFTGSKIYDVHHLKSFNQIIKEVLIELGYELKIKYSSEEYLKIKNKVIELHNKLPLGICMSTNIHILFHQLYFKDTISDDFYEFEKRYSLGEFDKILKEVS